MHKIIYGLLYIISLLPLRLLYLISDLIYFLLYHVAGYRKAVVRKNLLIAFPAKPEKERQQIEAKFYQNFVDSLIETLKLISASPSFINKHFSMDPALLEQQYKKGNRCQFYLAHHFNWEYANLGVSAITPYTMLMVYLPLSSGIFEKIMLKLRSKTGNNLIPATQMTRAMIPFRNAQYLLALIADQAPGDVSKAYWLNFFGKPTPFLRGPERGAAAANLSVFFCHMYKLRRGYYKLSYELITEKPNDLPKGTLTGKYVAYLENTIREHPEMWLWTHRRWKYQWSPEYAKNWIGEDPVPSTIN